MKSIKHYRTVDYAVLSIVAISVLLHLFFISSNNLLVEEAYYWNYSAHLDFGYLDHPPMVAALISLSTSIFGTHELGVRIPSLFCWLLTAFFSFRLTNLITHRAGQYAVMLLAVLPFFFLQFLVITPDQPLLVCWAAVLYYLYRSLILNESHCWYAAGIWFGLGMLSKYSIVLLGPATLLYLWIVPEARVWFTRKEPYICALLIALLFTPVIYWNATHAWASFIFQGVRRFKSEFHFSFHYFIGWLFLFLTPLGVLGLWALLKKNVSGAIAIEIRTTRFLQLFTMVPLLFFGAFSLNHLIKFDWIGPIFLALIPWLATLIKKSFETNSDLQQAKNSSKLKSRLGIYPLWLITAIILLFVYSALIFSLTFGNPEEIQKKLFVKFMDWSELTQQLYKVAQQVEAKTHKKPIFVPLDIYNLSSELSFYQAKLLAQGKILNTYPVLGSHVFGRNSLMFQYWSKKRNYSDNPLILIATSADYFTDSRLKEQVIEKSSIHKLKVSNQRKTVYLHPYYYEVVQKKNIF